MNGEPLVREHVARTPVPWRPRPTLTECGRPITELRSVLNRRQAVEKIRREGVTRAAYTTCMTCWDTIKRWPTWDEDPVQVIAREFSPTFGSRKPEQQQELAGIAGFLDANAEQLRAYLADHRGTIDIRAERQARRAPQRWVGPA